MAIVVVWMEMRRMKFGRQAYFDKLLKRVEQEHFCLYPFTQMMLTPAATVTPCCWKQEFVLGDLRASRLEEIWNGEKIRELRRDFLSGNPTICANQMRHIQCHKSSCRHSLLDFSETEFQPRPPIRLDLRLNGQCNLRCVMCEVWKEPSGLYEETDFWTQGKAHLFAQLKEIDMLGGEPFIQKDTYRLIDEVRRVNAVCEWSFVTNGQYVFNDFIRGQLDRIRLRWVVISLDSLDPEIYARIRGGKHSRTMRTLYEFSNYCEARDDFNLQVSMCVQKDNWHEIPEMIQFVDRLGLELILQFAYIPPDRTLLALSTKEKRDIVDDLLRRVPEDHHEILMPITSPLLAEV